MISVFIAGLALVFQVLTAAPAWAVSFPECQAWLCLPGGFPPWECDAAHTAVLRRLAALQPALPPWSSCASAFGWDSASLSHDDYWHDECPQGGTPDATGIAAAVCSGTAGACTFTYSAQKKVRVTVGIDGSTAFAPNNRLLHVAHPPGAMVLVCPPPPIVPGIVGGPPASAALAGAGASAGGAGGASGGAAGGF